MTDDLTSETGTQVSSIEMILRCNAGSQVDSSLTCEALMQTPNGNEQPENRTDGGAAEKGKEELKSKIAELEKFLKEKDRQIWKGNETIQEMKKRQRSEIHYIKMKEEMEKSSLLCKIRGMRQEIISLKERRPPPTERDTEDLQANKRSDHTGRREAGGFSNDQQWANQRHCSNEQDLGKNRNLPPRPRNRNLPPRIQNCK
jgi:hypothetical protein